MIKSLTKRLILIPHYVNPVNKYVIDSQSIVKLTPHNFMLYKPHNENENMSFDGCNLLGVIVFKHLPYASYSEDNIIVNLTN